jgi:hypothetical protein
VIVTVGGVSAVMSNAALVPLTVTVVVTGGVPAVFV